MNDKIITVLLAILIALSGWSLSTTVGLKSDVAVLKEKVSKMEKDIEDAVWNTLEYQKNKKNKKNKKKKKKKKLNVE
jgi:hypothetical protein|tara:strand:+ start:786 stop:1016 length:231 start_codon:yes stop_codon:yes gene_type:complete